MMSDDFRQFLTPHPPLIRFCPISAHAPIIWCPILTPRSPPPSDLNKNMCFFQIVEDLLRFAPLSIFVQNTTSQWGEIFSEGAFWFNEPEFSRNIYKVVTLAKKVKKYIRKGKKSINQQKKGPKILEKSDVLFWLSYLPPLSDFVPFCLTPPSPPKIGHHLCMFPKLSKCTKTFSQNGGALYLICLSQSQS